MYVMQARYGKLLIALFCLMLALPAAAQQAPKATEDNTATHLFQVVVLIGSKEMSKPSTDVPNNVRAALDDIGQFLPYKSYRMVDTVLIRSAGQGRGVMAGPDDHDYLVHLRYEKNGLTGKLFVKDFQLNDPSRNANSILIQTSFEVNLRETIVVGSSKLNGGGEALVVLFTAVE
jgi:hypothetical protein